MSSKPLILTPGNHGDFSLDQQARLLSTLDQSGPVLMKSDTGYGLTVTPTNHRAVDRVRQILRLGDAPIPLCIDSLRTAKTITRFTHSHHRLASGAWPGPTTIVAPIDRAHGRGLHRSVGQHGTVGLRIPTEIVERHLALEAGGVLTSPAVRYPDGKIVRDLTDAIDIVTEAMSTMPPFPWVAVRSGRRFAFSDHSTVVKFDGRGDLHEIRAGAVALADLKALLWRPGYGDYSDAT